MIKIQTYLLEYIWSKMLSSYLFSMLKMSKTSSQKLFDYDCVTLYNVYICQYCLQGIFGLKTNRSDTVKRSYMRHDSYTVKGSYLRHNYITVKGSYLRHNSNTVNGSNFIHDSNTVKALIWDMTLIPYNALIWDMTLIL